MLISINRCEISKVSARHFDECFNQRIGQSGTHIKVATSAADLFSQIFPDSLHAADVICELSICM